MVVKTRFCGGIRQSPLKLNYYRKRAFHRVQPGHIGLPTRTCWVVQYDGMPLVPPQSGVELTGYYGSRYLTCDAVDWCSVFLLWAGDAETRRVCRVENENPNHMS